MKSTRAYASAAVAIFTLLLHSSSAEACETCAVYNATNLRAGIANTWSVSISQQYTDYQLASGISNELLRDGEILKGYSVTQADLSYDFSEQTGVQLSLPFIHRSFDKLTSYKRERDSESGLGDSSLLVDFSPYSKREIDFAFHSLVFAGLKAPTGDTGSLDEQVSGEESERISVKHHQSAGIPGLQGRVLSLGTGSWDTFYGLGALLRFDRMMFSGTAEYTLRTEGDFDYRFANDFIWSAGPAYYVLLEDEHTFAVQALFTGEHKGKDVHDGVKVSGTAITNIFCGPSLVYSRGEHIAGELSFMLPIYTDDRGALVVPEFRIQAALSYFF